MSKPTPGPWRANFFQGIHLIVEPLDQGAARICELHLPGRGSGEAVANARLLTAAPELLAVCERILSLSDMCGRCGGFGLVGNDACDRCGGTGELCEAGPELEAIRAAVAKATGEAK